MKDMSYRDKMVILVISIIVILVAGFFALIRPKYQALVADTSTYESTKTEWEGIEQKINAIPTLKPAIEFVNLLKDSELIQNQKTICDYLSYELGKRVHLYGVPRGTQHKVPVFSFTASAQELNPSTKGDPSLNCVDILIV